MTKINTYGLKMTGLRKAASETKCLSRYRSPYVQISYDRETGEVITNYHASENSWSDYHNADIYTVCRASVPMTMQQIADAIKKETDWRNTIAF